MFLIIFILWWAWQALKFILDWPALKEMHEFYHHLLEIPDVRKLFLIYLGSPSHLFTFFLLTDLLYIYIYLLGRYSDCIMANSAGENYKYS